MHTVTGRSHASVFFLAESSLDRQLNLSTRGGVQGVLLITPRYLCVNSSAGSAEVGAEMSNQWRTQDVWGAGVGKIKTGTGRDIFIVKRGHFITFSALEGHLRGHLITFCLLEGHPRGQSVMTYHPQEHKKALFEHEGTRQSPVSQNLTLFANNQPFTLTCNA